MSALFLKATSPRGEVATRFSTRRYLYAAFHVSLGQLVAVTFHFGVHSAKTYKAHAATDGRFVVQVEAIEQAEFKALKQAQKGNAS